MKNLDKIINEARGTKSVEPTTIHFESGAEAMLFACELSGQISDGKYENSRPASHSNWLLYGDITYEIDGNIGYEGPSHRLEYNLNEWPGYIKKGGDWAWAERIIGYAAMGLSIEEGTLQKILNDSKKEYGIRVLAEEWQRTVNNGKKFKEVEIADYQKKYFDTVSEINTASNFKSFAKILPTITNTVLRGHLSSMSESVNTPL